ncbi:MAG: MFS transporter [Acidimicrobiia bacterium]|nr:MFS transporter [Acidimicrobiia bacterium]
MPDSPPASAAFFLIALSTAVASLYFRLLLQTRGDSARPTTIRPCGGAGEMTGWRSMGRRVVVDTTPLRESPRFRSLYLGHMLSFLGRQIAEVAVPLQIYLLTESTLAVGVLGMAQFIPLMIMSPLGGAITDAVDRRKLLVVSQLVVAVTAAGLALNAGSPDPRVWPLYVLSGINAVSSAVELPARMAVVPSLLRRELLPAGFALNQTMTQVAAVVVPAAAGFLIARFSLTLTYVIELVAFVGAALASIGVGRLLPEGGGRSVSVSSITEGLSYLRRERLIQSCFVIDLNAMIFGMPRALFPAMGTGIFAGNAATVGLLHAAPGAGALLAAVTSGWIGGVRRQGRVVIMAVVVWGFAITIFGFIAHLPLALVLLAVAGGADAISAVLRNTILQLKVPDALRGRLASTHIAVVSGGPRLGDLESGVVASLTSVRFSVVSGGLACLVGALAIGRYMPQLWRYQNGGGTDPPES